MRKGPIVFTHVIVAIVCLIAGYAAGKAQLFSPDTEKATSVMQAKPTVTPVYTPSLIATDAPVELVEAHPAIGKQSGVVEHDSNNRLRYTCDNSLRTITFNGNELSEHDATTISYTQDGSLDPERENVFLVTDITLQFSGDGVDLLANNAVSMIVEGYAYLNQRADDSVVNLTPDMIKQGLTVSWYDFADMESLKSVKLCIKR